MLYIGASILASAHALKVQQKSYGSEEVVNYLLQYGYLEPPKEGAPPNPFSADEYESALKTAQKFAGIPATGVFDNQTRVMLSARRCGVPDTGSRLKRYSTSSKRWPTLRISYSFMNYSPKLTVTRLKKRFLRLMIHGQDQQGLRFIHLHSDRADMQIGFFRGEHGDGPSGVLGHAFFPGPGIGGDLHLDEDENWSTDEYNLGRDSTSLLCTVTHELGHALGLKHSNVPGSIMQPIYSGQTKIGKDDILGIESLYHYI